jgi:hypothetical protein
VAVDAACVESPIRLTGATRKVRNSLTAHLSGLGIRSVTFYLDGRWLKTVTRSQHGRFSITINVTKLSYGAHRLVAKARCGGEAIHAATVAAGVPSVSVPIAMFSPSSYAYPRGM